MLPEDAGDGLLADSELRHLDSGKPEAKTCGNTWCRNMPTHKFAISHTKIKILADD
jgi:hypothetical protein